MAGLKVDLDRDILYEVSPDRRPPGGVVMRIDPVTNAQVWMYRTEPGAYYSSHGQPVSQSMAKRAGFDVERWAKEREKQTKMKDFEAKFNEQIRSVERKVLEERNGYRLVSLGMSRFHIEDTEGNVMTPGLQASTLKEGQDWLSDFAGEPEDGDVSGAGGSSEVRVDRRPAEDGPTRRQLRKSGDQETPVSA